MKKKLLFSCAALFMALALNATTGPAPTNLRWDGDTIKWDLPILGGDSTIENIFITYYTDKDEYVFGTSGSSRLKYYINVCYPGMSYYYTVQLNGKTSTLPSANTWQSELVTSLIHTASGARDTLDLPSVTLDVNGEVTWINHPNYYQYIKTRVTLQKKVDGVWTNLQTETTGIWSTSHTFGAITEPGTYRAIAENVQGSYVVTRGVSEELVVTKSCTIHFDGNGKITNPADTTAAEGALAPLPKITDAAQTDRLLYWTRQSDGTGGWNFAKDTIKSDTTLYAQWAQWEFDIKVSDTECKWTIPAEVAGVIKNIYANLNDDKMNYVSSSVSTRSDFTSTTIFNEKIVAGKKYYIVIRVTDQFGNSIADMVEYLKPVAVESIELDATAPFELTVGATRQLIATVLPDTATNKNVVWSSDNEGVLTVVDGLVEAVAVGTANVTVKSVENEAIFATIAVTVKANATAIEQVELNSLEVRDGRIYCDGEFRIYDLVGRDVTRLNGNLQGVYIIKYGDKATKVVVR